MVKQKKYTSFNSALPKLIKFKPTFSKYRKAKEKSG